MDATQERYQRNQTREVIATIGDLYKYVNDLMEFQLTTTRAGGQLQTTATQKVDI